MDSDVTTLLKLFRAIQDKTECKPFFTELDEVLQQYNGDDWRPLVWSTPQTLVKERVYYSHNLEVMLLSWPAGYTTQLHDHAANGCWLKVLSGQLTETRYNEEFQQQEVTLLPQDSISFMSNSQGYHTISNESGQTTWSLHIYSPPFHKTRYFEL